MKNFIDLDTHNIIDYVHGATVAGILFIAGFPREAVARNTCLGLGLGVIAYSALTRYRWSLAKAISLGPHMAIDVASGVALAAAPFALGYRWKLRLWQVALHGILGLGAVSATRPRTESQRKRMEIESSEGGRASGYRRERTLQGGSTLMNRKRAA